MGPQFTAFLDYLLRLALWLTTLVVIFVPLERLFAAHPQKVWRKGVVTDLGYYFMNALVPAAVLSVPVALLAWAVQHTIPGGLLARTEALPLWGRVLGGIVAGEVGYYWGHRWSHEIPFLWRFHSIHHSAPEVDFLVSTRGHPVDVVFGRFCGLVPLYVLGLGGPVGASGTLVPALVGLFGAGWGFFIHANLRWRFGPLEWLITTPAFHHWHHTLSGPINRNYASTLPWIDSIFGTRYVPDDGSFPAAYGIEAKLPDTLLGQLAHPILDDEPVAVSMPEVAAASLSIETDGNVSYASRAVE